MTPRSAPWWLLLAAIACGDGAPIDPSVGEVCSPDDVPCDREGKNCGFRRGEWYVDGSSQQCPSNVCLVRMLDNGTAGAVPADPRVVCSGENQPENCVTQAAIDEAMYCSCRCAASDGRQHDDMCTCGSGYQCEPFAVLGDSYCVKSPR